MPVTYEIDGARRLVRTRCFGAVTISEVLAHFGELERDPARPELLDVVPDLSGSTALPGSDQLRVVADRDSMFGMARMFEVFAEKHFGASRVFRQLDEAERWLADAGDRE